MIAHVFGTVDDDELLSLRFGPPAHEKLPNYVETKLCDVFWKGSMCVALIEAFSRGNKSVDFTLTLRTDGLALMLMAVEADGWPLDPRLIGKVLRLPAELVICEHGLRVQETKEQASEPLPG